MKSIYFLCLFLLLDSIWLFYIWSVDFDKEIISPKYISSSYNENSKIKFKSRVLTSISPILFKIFPSSQSVISTHTGDIPIGKTSMISQLDKEKNYNNSLLHQSDIQKNKINSFYEIFFDEKKENLLVLKLHTDFNFFGDKSVISLYSISVNNFIINSREEFDLTKSCLNKIYEKKITGVVQKFSISNDKKYLGILITKNVENSVQSIINFIHLDKILNNNIANVTFNNSSNITNNIFEIENEIDEIELEGNLPIINIDVSKNIIVVSRENKKFIDIIIKNNTSNKWDEINLDKYFYSMNLSDNDTNITNTIDSNNTNITSILNVNNNSTNNISLNNNITSNANNSYLNNSSNILKTYYNRITSFKIIKNNNTNLELLELYVSINSRGVYASSLIINLNISNISNYTNLPLVYKELLSSRIDKEKPENVGKNITYIYDIRASLPNLEVDYFHKSAFSKNILTIDNLINFEYFHRALAYINTKTYELKQISYLSSKIESICSDSSNNNLLVIDKEENMFFFHKKNGKNEYEYDYKEINLDNIPNNYQNNEILASYLETFKGNITRLFLLVDSGVILSLDFSKIIKKLNRNVVSVFISDYFYTIIMIGLNVGVIVFSLTRRKNKRRRDNEIRNILNTLSFLRRN